MGLRTFTFDGVQSSDFGVFFTEASPYNAPERAVEMIDIPGRNGAYALDLGKFENIEVTYHAVVAANNNTNFTEAISNFRNFLCSRVGYCRLTDDYNPGEYRMATYRSGLETDGVYINGAEFDIVFDCKPQRYLAIGEELVEIGAWGNTETVEGDIVTIDASSDTAVKALTADIDPIQDLHGYDAPWVGGAGKNIFDYTTYNSSKGGLTISLQNGVFTVTGTLTTSYAAIVASADITSKLEDGQNYTISQTNITPYVYPQVTGTRYDSTKAYYHAGQSNTTFTVDKSTFQTYEIIFMAGTTSTWGASSRTIQTSVMLEKGSSATSWTPYTNICPISGHDEVTVTVADDVDNPTVSEDYTTTLGTTVYGGYIDFVNGLLSITDIVKAITGTTTVLNSYLNRDSTALIIGYDFGDTKKVSSADELGYVISDYAQTTSTNGLYISNDTLVTTTKSGYLQIMLKDITVLNDAKAYLGANPLTVCYKLETPMVFQLTPQQIALLLGENNIFADSGNVTVEYGHDPAVLTNPTLFDAKPQLQVWGYGDINLTSNQTTRTVSVYNVPIGDMTVYAGKTLKNPPTAPLPNAAIMEDSVAEYAQIGDTITLKNTKFNAIWYDNSLVPTSANASNSGNGTASVNIGSIVYNGIKGYLDCTVETGDVEFTYGTSKTETNTATFTCMHGTTQISGTIAFTITYDGDSRIDYTATMTLPTQLTNVSPVNGAHNWSYIIGEIHLYSTKSALGQPMYIDLDIGEAYNIENGSAVSVNNAVELPAELPTLPSGDTEVTYDNTVTKLEVQPRWWKV